jgi:hypothetical protein
VQLEGLLQTFSARPESTGVSAAALQPLQAQLVERRKEMVELHTLVQQKLELFQSLLEYLAIQPSNAKYGQV